jgi:hypothetical protein
MVRTRGLIGIGAMAAMLVCGVSAADARPALNLWSIRGVVLDADGEPVVDAVVSDGDRATRTDANGIYRFADENPGTYELRASAQCSLSSQKQVTLLVPGEAEVDFVLEAAPGCESVGDEPPS